MRTTILMAGLLAGLAGTALLAQTATTSDEMAAEAPAGTAPDAVAAAPETDTEPRAYSGPMGVPGLAPHELYDSDGDGNILQEEIQAGRAARFAAADADGDRALSAEELLVMEEALREEMRLARAAQVVKRMDDNGDGVLQAAELEARAPQLAPIFDRLDADNDGGISQSELEAGRVGGERGFGRDGRDRGAGPRGHRGGFMGGLLGG